MNTQTQEIHEQSAHKPWSKRTDAERKASILAPMHAMFETAIVARMLRDGLAPEKPAKSARQLKRDALAKARAERAPAERMKVAFDVKHGKWFPSTSARSEYRAAHAIACSIEASHV